MSRIFAAAGITETLLRGVSLITGERSFSAVMLLTLFTLLSTALVGVALIIIESFRAPAVLSLDDSVAQEAVSPKDVLNRTGIGVDGARRAIPGQR